MDMFTTIAAWVGSASGLGALYLQLHQHQTSEARSEDERLVVDTSNAEWVNVMYRVKRTGEPLELSVTALGGDLAIVQIADTQRWPDVYGGILPLSDDERPRGRPHQKIRMRTELGFALAEFMVVNHDDGRPPERCDVQVELVVINRANGRKYARRTVYRTS